jgi:tight adherence protein B
VNLQYLLPIAGVSLAVTGAGTAVLLAADARRRRLAHHIAERVTPLAPARAPSRAGTDSRQVSALADFWSRHVLGRCGYRPERRDAYPLGPAPLLLLPTLPSLLLERLLSALLGLGLAPALPLIWLLSCRVLFGYLHAHHAQKLYRQFPDVLAMIVRSVRAGIPLHEAMRVVARESLEPSARQFVLVYDQIKIGMRLDEALRDATRRTGVAEYGFFTVALTLQAQTGGSLAETLENLADVIRKRVASRLRAKALASEARTSAIILAVLPVVAGVALPV